MSRWWTGSLCYLRRLIKSAQSCQRKNEKSQSDFPTPPWPFSKPLPTSPHIESRLDPPLLSILFCCCWRVPLLTGHICEIRVKKKKAVWIIISHPWPSERERCVGQMISLFFSSTTSECPCWDLIEKKKTSFNRPKKERKTKRSISTNNKVFPPSSFNLLKTFAEDCVTRCVIHSPFKLMKVKTKKGENKKRERETNDTVDSAERKLQLIQHPTDWWIFSSCFVCVCVFEVAFVWELHVPFDVCVLYTLLLFGNPIAYWNPWIYKSSQ